MSLQSCVRSIGRVAAFFLLLPFTAVHAQEDEAKCPDASAGEAATLDVPAERQQVALTALCPFAQANTIALTTAAISDTPAYEQQVQQDVASGQVTLAFVSNLPMLANLFTTSKPVSLDDLEVSENAVGSNWLGMGLFSTGSAEPSSYGLPLEVAFTSSLVWYNPRLFNKYGYQVPHSFDQFRTLLAQIASDKSGLAPVAVGSDTLTNIFIDMLSRTQSADTLQALFSSNGSFEADAVVAALQDFRDIAQPYFRIYASINDALRAPFGSDPTAFMTIGGSATDLVIADRVKLSAYGDQYAFFPLPTQDGKPGILQGTSTFMMAFQNSTPGRQLLQYLASPDGAAAWAKAAQTLSPILPADLDVPLIKYDTRPALNDLALLLNHLSDEQVFLAPYCAFGDAFPAMNQALAALVLPPQEPTPLPLPPTAAAPIAAEGAGGGGAAPPPSAHGTATKMQTALTATRTLTTFFCKNKFGKLSRCYRSK